MRDFQSVFLDKLQQERQTVTIITTNGYQARGQITGHDRYTVVLTGKDGQQLTYDLADIEDTRTAISTIVPERRVELREEG